MKAELSKLNIIFIILVPLSVNYYYGSIGVFPIDTFAFFDSSNLISKGFLPIRDYWTSNGFLIDLIQSIFFKIFGVNWQIYLLHSSIVNFLLTFFTYKFLTSEGLNHKYSLLYSLCAGILALSIIWRSFSRSSFNYFFNNSNLFFCIFYPEKFKILSILDNIFFILGIFKQQVPANFL